MKTPNYGRWSELPMDMLGSVLESLSIRDFHRAKMVCSNWYLCSKQMWRPKYGSPLLMLSPEEDRCRMYSPGDDRVYETKKSDFSGYRFLGSSGTWFLAVDSRLKLSIIDVFSDERIDLPPLESIKDGRFSVERVGDKGFTVTLLKTGFSSVRINVTVEHMIGVLWVDDKNRDYVVVWQFERDRFLRFCKKGDDHYRHINTLVDLRSELRGGYDMVLKGYMLYFFANGDYIQHLDLSGEDGFKDLSENHRFPRRVSDLSFRDEYETLRAIKVISGSYNMAVTTSG
ncbi:unnamed protein product [Microthlaspi erraticum]|uniref:Uncharacterized protein n=1 Tax=Microthlaspi erraticum TaxID=1685480 RepID=A0A6D2ICH3_9BRAS|nr:unnamed protein product [Microthlaspi erraticum]